MKVTTIDTSVLPEIWLQWTTSNEAFYLECATGIKSNNHPRDIARYGNPKKRLINAGSKPRFAYAKYHEDIEMLELAEATIATTRKEEPKEWKYAGNKYFLCKDKRVLDENGNVVTGNFYLSRHHNCATFKEFLSYFIRIEVSFNAIEFKKFLGSYTYTVGSGRVATVHSAWNIREWYTTTQKVRGPGKQQKLTDKLVAMPVKDVKELYRRYAANVPTNGWGGSGIICFERLNDGWSVLRVLDKKYLADEFTETSRMYLHDDGSNRIVSPTKDGWVPARQNFDYGRYKFPNKTEATEKCKRLKYIIPLIDDEEDGCVKKALITILRFPELEQMISLGYKTQAMRIARSNTPGANLKHMFGEYYNAKETTILRKAGLNKHQFDMHMQTYATSGYMTVKSEQAMREMRKMFGDGLIHLDNTSFDDYYNGFYAMSRGYNRAIYPQLERMGIDRNRFIKNVFRLGKKNKEVYTVVDDTLYAYNALNIGTQPEIDWYFDSYSDVARVHDAIDGLKRMQDAERRAMWNKAEAERLKREEKKRAELDEKRKEYEYDDDNYVIRLPKDCQEIIREGNLQRICIGGYTSRHATGQTNLFFLRRKSEPDAPFYAIEMDNGKNIVQIHGYCNKWCGNNPEVIPTVVRWLRKNGIKCDTKILTCTATGYGSNGRYVQMPVVD